MYEVKRVTRQDCEEYILRIHYAHRWPNITYAFGLFRDGVLCGIVVYGNTCPTLRMHLVGEGLSTTVIELTRLCLKDNLKNEASILVSRSIKLLPKPKTIVSFADTEQNHVGYIYQATNFIYTGLSFPDRVFTVRGKEDIHKLTLAEGCRRPDGTRSMAELRKKYAGQYYYKESSRKHRYVYFHGGRKFCKQARVALRYEPRPYPKATDTIESLEDSFKQQDALELFDSGQELSSNDFSELIS